MGPISGTSDVFAGISRWARGTPPGVAADSRIREVPSGRRAPLTYFPSQATCGIRPGAPPPPSSSSSSSSRSPPLSPAACSTRSPSARYRQTASSTASGSAAPRTRATVLGHGACRVPSGSARAPAAASRPWSAAEIQQVIETRVWLSHSIAIMTSARTQASGCRTPRGSRGSGTAAKTFSMILPPQAAPRFPDPVQHRLPLPPGRLAQLLIPFGLLSGLPFPFPPGQALLLPPAGLPPLPPHLPVLFLPDHPLRLREHRLLISGRHGRGSGQHGRMSVQRGPPGG